MKRKKVAINIEYNGKNVISDYVNFTDEEIEGLRELIGTIVEGKALYFHIKSGNKEHYFPKKIIENSVISLIFSTENDI